MNEIYVIKIYFNNGIWSLKSFASIICKDQWATGKTRFTTKLVHMREEGQYGDSNSST